MPDEPNLQNVPNPIRWEQARAQMEQRDIKGYVIKKAEKIDQAQLDEMQQIRLEWERQMERHAQAVAAVRIDPIKQANERFIEEARQVNAMPPKPFPEFVHPPMVDPEADPIIDIPGDFMEMYDGPRDETRWNVRPFLPGDTDAVARLLLGEQHPHVLKYLSLFGPDQRGKLDSSVSAFVALSDYSEQARVVGYVAVCAGQLMIVVDESWRRAGIAIALLSRVREHIGQIEPMWAKYRIEVGHVGLVRAMFRAHFTVTDVEYDDAAGALLVFSIA